MVEHKYDEQNLQETNQGLSTAFGTLIFTLPLAAPAVNSLSTLVRYCSQTSTTVYDRLYFSWALTISNSVDETSVTLPLPRVSLKAKAGHSEL